MKSTEITDCEAIVIGSGMGGLTIASLLARDGDRPVVLEAAHSPGGCSSSYVRKGHTFESGATTLIGFDAHQPLAKLESLLGIKIPRREINPGMAVYLNNDICIRYKDRDKWIQEASRCFGNPTGQQKFWNKVFELADFVWKSSDKNVDFPPYNITDWLKLGVKNNPLDIPKLRYAYKSVRDIMEHYRVDTPEFVQFIDEQLMITAQATSTEVPFLFGAAAISYTNSSNYYVNGGLIEMINVLIKYIEEHGGKVLTKHKVTKINQFTDGYVVTTERKGNFRSKLVYSNIPIWNLSDLTTSDMKSYFQNESKGFDQAWGAFTMGIVMRDNFHDDLTLHHQIHTDQPIQHIMANSVFVSMSAKDDAVRSKKGTRVLNVSCHTLTDQWFNIDETYEEIKNDVESEILQILNDKLPGFNKADIIMCFSSTPVSWESWVYRYRGRLGGIPQSMNRSLLSWPQSITPFNGFYLCGDTVYPGQGIPGVTLGGINVYYRSEKFRKKLK